MPEAGLSGAAVGRAKCCNILARNMAEEMRPHLLAHRGLLTGVLAASDRNLSATLQRVSLQY
jgi:hypothetical protein